MIDLQTFFKIHFNSQRISNHKLHAFSESHIQRLKTNNMQNKYDAMIVETEEVSINFYKSILDEGIECEAQKNYTERVNELIKKFKNTVSEKEVIINVKWGKNSHEYSQFFPFGVTEYIKANKSNIDILMESFIELSEKYIDELEQYFIDTFVNIRDEYYIARKKQLEQKGIVTAKKNNTATKRRILEVQLQKNLLLIAYEYVGEPQLGIVFFDQSILRSYKSKRDEIEGNDNIYYY